MTPAEEQAHIARLVSNGEHIFIEASAGSGKTTRLVSLIVEIIRQGKARLPEILCVTFTEKAASELKARIFARLAAEKGEHTARALSDFSTNSIGTIHSFYRAALREDPARAGEEGLEANADEKELFEEAREYVFRIEWQKLGADQLAGYLEELDFGKKNFVSRERALDAELRPKCLYLFGAHTTPVSPEIADADLIRTATDFKAWTIRNIVMRMRELVEGKNLLTFSGMIAGTADAIQNPEFVRKLRSRYRYALIDEFQDTDALQWQIFKTLFLNAKNTLIVVGDPKQAIYKFRGADVFVYLHAREEMLAEGAFADRLPRNHRSTPEILSALDSIFAAPEVAAVWHRANINYAIPERARASDAESGVEFYRRNKYSASAREDFAHLAAGRISDLKRRHPDWTIAIIAFKHHTLEICADVLRASGIEYAYYRQKPDFARVEFTHLGIFLQSFALPAEEGYALALKTLFLKAEKEPAEYYRRLAAHINEGRILVFLQNLAQNLNSIQLLMAIDPDRNIYHGWRVLTQKLLALCGEKIFDLESLRAVLHTMEHDPDEDERGGDMLRSPGAVTLLTVASAKGLDWDVVLLADGYSDKRWQDFPFFHDARGNAIVPADAEVFESGSDKLMPIAEEARITQLNLLYVALTRAKQKFITYIIPPWRENEAGPASYFLTAWAEIATVPLLDFDEAVAAIPSGIGKQAEPNLPVGVEHGTIPARIRERTSFSRLTVAEFSETNFIEDILPRGSGVGEILHGILENCDFTMYRKGRIPDPAALTAEIIPLLGNIRRDGKDITPQVAERILGIIAACSAAELPLRNAGAVSLCDLPPENLWREMPFWSAAATHRVLREYAGNETRRSMHGFMDLVFTVDEKDYYILDYKSNSLSSVTPENIDGYTREHYALQAEIYSEALSAYLRKNYPGENRRVAGCYFLFLRYLKPDSREGVHFTEAADA